MDKEGVSNQVKIIDARSRLVMKFVKFSDLVLGPNHQSSAMEHLTSFTLAMCVTCFMLVRKLTF